MQPGVVHLVGDSSLHASGVGRIVEALALGLRGRFRTEAWFRRPGPLPELLTERGIAVRVLDWGGPRAPLAAARFGLALRAGRWDVVHQHFAGRATAVVARLASARVVVHLHGRVDERDPASPRTIRAPGAGAVIAISETVARQVHGVAPVVIHPCAPPGRPARLPHDSPAVTIGTLSRLVPVKGLSTLLCALAAVRRAAPGVRLEVAGDGPLRPALEREAAALGLASAVSFLGWQREVAPLLARWDLYVQPSLEEAFGLGVLEAMAAGLPVVASAAGGLPELVEEGVTGVLVPPGDPGALAAAISQLLADAGRRDALGLAGRERAARLFSCERMVEATEAVYRRLLGGA